MKTKQFSFLKQALALVMAFCSVFMWGQTVWTYDFGTGTGTFTSSTASTSFLPAPQSNGGTARVRVGTNPGSIILANPGLALGSGSEMQFKTNSGSTSTTKFSIYDYTASKAGYFKANVTLNGGTTGVYNLMIGDGANFSDNNAIANAQVFAGLRLTFGASNSISTAVLSNATWVTTGLTNASTLFAQSDTNIYAIEIYYNNTTTPTSYERSGSNSLTNATWDLWVNGTKVGTGLAKGAFGTNLNVDSFALNHQISVAAGTQGTVYLDDLEYSNGLPAVATPTISSMPTSLNGFTYVQGAGPSTEQSFSVTGSNLSASIDVSASANWEVSLAAASGYANAVQLPATGGTVYTRLSAGLTENPTYTGSITLASTGATDVTVNLSGSVTAPPVTPVVTGASLNGTVGTVFSYQIQATGTPDSYAVSTGTLPAGLSLNTTTGLISGTPTAAGNVSVDVTATNGAGTSVPATLDFTIAQGTQTAALPDLTPSVGASAITLPAATNAGLTITYISDNPAVASVSGNTLTVGNTGTATVTASNAGNADYTAFNDTFTVTVTNPPVSILEFDFAGIAGDEVSFGSSTNATGLEASVITRGAGLTASTNADRFNAINWATTSIANAVSGNDYMEFTVTPGLGYQFSVSAITFQIQRSGTGLSAVALRSSADNYAADLDGQKTVTDNTGTQAFTFNFIQADSTGPVIYRLYGYSEAAGGSAGIGDFTGSDLTITGNVTVDPAKTVWAGSPGAWTNGTPVAGLQAIIAADYAGTSFESQSLTVNTGFTLTVNTFVKTGDVENNGNITVANNANFVQTGNFTAGTGSAFKVWRDTKPAKRLAYIGWSSPLESAAQTLKAFSYGRLADGVTPQSATGTVDNRFLTYNNEVFVSTPATGTFTPAGKGFQIRTPNDFTTTPQVFHGLFEGSKPNSGTVNYDHSGITGDFVLLGNPYPSAISVQEFLNANPGTTETVYFWNSEAEMDVNGQYTGTNYNTYAPGTGAVPLNSVNGYIPVAQGFFVERGTAATPIVFTNAMRQTTETGIFSKAPATDKFWLQLNTTTGAAPQMLFAFNSAATAGIDAGYDAKMLDSNTESLYTKVGTEKLIIDSHGAFQNTDHFDVFLNTNTVRNYTVSLLHGDGIFAGSQAIYLRDKVTGTFTNLSTGSYSFTSTGTGEENRFEILFQPQSILGTAETVKDEVIIYSAGTNVHVKSAEKISRIELYDLSGRLLAASKGNARTEMTIAVNYTGPVLVQAVLMNGNVVRKKVMVGE
ncbi:MAG: putative Ig domain-containing protein [Kaistella sp.]|nr:putative Ig domain-containing protein [Kaistella sp.]